MHATVITSKQFYENVAVCVYVEQKLYIVLVDKITQNHTAAQFKAYPILLAQFIFQKWLTVFKTIFGKMQIILALNPVNVETINTK